MYSTSFLDVGTVGKELREERVVVLSSSLKLKCGLGVVVTQEVEQVIY